MDLRGPNSIVAIFHTASNTIVVPVVEYDNHSFFDWHETWFGVIEWRVDRPIVYCMVDVANDVDDVPAALAVPARRHVATDTWYDETVLVQCANLFGSRRARPDDDDDEDDNLVVGCNLVDVAAVVLLALSTAQLKTFR